MEGVLCLDIATKTGWAIRQYDGVQSGVAHFKTSRFSGGGMRFLKFNQWLSEMYYEKKFTQVRFEEVRRHIGTDAAHAYGGFIAMLTSFCESNGIPYEGVPVGTIKKHATGKGNAKKDMMIQAMRDRGFNPADDNEADALALLCYVEGR